MTRTGLPPLRVFASSCALLSTSALALAVACSNGGSGDPAITSTDGVLCTNLLQYGCCGLSPDCVDHWSDALVCSAWPSGVKPLVYDTPCGGFVAIQVETTALRLYDQASGYLTAIVEPGDVPVCDLGPPALALTAQCLATWQASTATSCTETALSAPPLVLCPPPAEDAGEDGAADAWIDGEPGDAWNDAGLRDSPPE